MSSKARKTNSKYLAKLGRSAKEDTKDKIENIIKLYEDAKISQITTAENIIKTLLQKGDEKARKKSSLKIPQISSKT